MTIDQKKLLVYINEQIDDLSQLARQAVEESNTIDYCHADMAKTELEQLRKLVLSGGLNVD